MKEAPKTSDSPSFEDLQAAQLAHEEELGKKEAEKKRAEEARAGAEVAYGERTEALGEAKALQANVDKLKKAHIQERIADREKLRESEIAKEQELEGVRGTVAEIDEQIKRIQSLVEGKDISKVAPAVQQALEKALAEKNEITRRSDALSGEIGKIKADQISDDEIKQYQDLKNRIESLNETVATIESNPFVIERLMEEAETENKIRDEVVNATVYGKYTSRSPVWRDFAKEMTQTFLSEEFESRGIDAIKDPKEREEAMKKLASEIAQGVEGGTDSFNDRDWLSKGKATGTLLKNLTGNLGTLDGTAGFLAIAEGAKDQYGRVDEEKMHAAIARHLKSLNLLRSYSAGVSGEYQNYALGNNGEHLKSASFSDRWGRFDSEMNKYGFAASPENPIVPRDAGREVMKESKDSFDKKKSGIVEIDKSVWREDKDKTGKEIEQLRGRLEELSAQLKEAEDVENRVRMGREDVTKLEMAIRDADRDLYEAKRRLDNSQRERQQAGGLAIFKKRKLDQALDSETSRIAALERQKKESEAALKDYKKLVEHAEELRRKEQTSWKLRDGVGTVENKLSLLEGKLANLNKRKE